MGGEALGPMKALFPSEGECEGKEVGVDALVNRCVCGFFYWWFSPRELWGYWLVHIVVPPMG